MAIQITASVGKKAGLPNFGSKSFSLSCTKEVTDIRNLEAESIKLHDLLEQIVEAQIEKDERDENAEHVAPVNRVAKSANNNGDWACSEKQAALIRKLLQDHSSQKSMTTWRGDPKGGEKLSSLMVWMVEFTPLEAPRKGPCAS